MKTIKNTPLRGLTALLLIVVGTWWLSGCQSDDFVEATPPANSKDVRLTFRVSDASNPGTYLPAKFDDGTFKDDLVALIFKKEVGETLRYERFRKVTIKDNVCSIFLPSTLIGVQFTMVLCANAKGILTDNPDTKLIDPAPEGGSQPIGRTYQKLIDEIGQFVPDCKAVDFALPMWAKIDDITVPENASNHSLGTGILLRSLCRVDVGINYPNAGTLGDVAEGLLTKFTLEKVHIARSVNKAQLIPSTGNWTANGDEYNVTAPSVPSDKKKVDWIEFTPNLPGISCQTMIYLPEQANKDLADDNLRPCVILEGTYKFSASETKGFYRVDFINTEIAGKPQVDLLRGHLIRFNITDVKGPGYKTKGEALNSKPMNIEVKLADYTIFNSNTIFDGQYHFTLNKKEVTMPRDKDVKYTLSVNTNIPVGEWKMRLKVWNSTTPDGQESNTTIENGNFRVTKTPGTDDNHTLTIETIKNWNSTDAQQNEATLLIDAKRLKIEIPLHQIDQSAADWEVGNVTDDKLGGSVLSRTSFLYTGRGVDAPKFDLLEIYGGGNNEFEIRIEDVDGVVIPKEKLWFNFRQVPTGETVVPTFKIDVGVNYWDEPRWALIVLKETGTVPGKEREFKIPITQSVMPYGNLLDPVNGVLWSDRNVGARSAAFDDQNFFIDTNENLVGRGNNICPVGWSVPSREDFHAMVNEDYNSSVKSSGLKNKILYYSEGIEYVMFYDDVNKMYFQSRGRVGLRFMYYWFVKEPIPSWNNDPNGAVYFYEEPGTGVVSNTVIEMDKNRTAHVRCVRKLSLSKSAVTLEPTGEEQAINLTTFENGERVTIKFEKENDKLRGFYVRQDGGLKLIVGCSQPNLTGSAISDVRVVISGKRFPNVTRTIIITQKAASKLVSDAHPFITIGNTDWYGKNVGASSFDNGYLHYQLVKNPNESMDFGERNYDNLNAEANTSVLNRPAFGTLYQQESALAECKKMGQEWRVPSPFEWQELLSRMRISKAKLAPITASSEVLHNTEEYPAYVVDDGQYRMYLPLGQASKGGNPDVYGLPVRAVSYHTNTGVGVTYTHVHLSRYLYGDKVGAGLYSYQWPWRENFMSHLTTDATHMASTVNYGTAYGYVRCVRSKKQ